MFKPSIALLLIFELCSGVGAIKCYQCTYSADIVFDGNDPACVATDKTKIPTMECLGVDKCVNATADVRGLGPKDGSVLHRGCYNKQYENVKRVLASTLSGIGPWTEQVCSSDLCNFRVTPPKIQTEPVTLKTTTELNASVRFVASMSVLLLLGFAY